MDERTPFDLPARGWQYRLTWQRAGQVRPRSKMFRRFEDAERRLARYQATVDPENGRAPIVYSRIDARRVTPWELGDEIMYDDGRPIEGERSPCRVCGGMDYYVRGRQCATCGRFND
jgi:hypothetical protein